MDPTPAEDVRLFNAPAEAAYLGLLLKIPQHFGRLRHLVAPIDFTRQQHRLIYEAMLAVADSGRAPDATLVIGELATRGHADDLGRWRLGEVAGVVAESPSPERLRDYALTLRDASARRRLLTLGQYLAEAAYREAPQSAIPRVRRWLDGLDVRLAELVPSITVGADDWAIVAPPPRAIGSRRSTVEVPVA